MTSYGSVYPILSQNTDDNPTRLIRETQCALTIMAKAPRPGVVKTRLSPPLTPEQAAALNVCFLQDTAQNIAEVCRSGEAAGLVAYTPIGDEPLFDGLLPFGFALIPQRGDLFGERLLYAAQDILARGFSSVCLIDSDSPTVPAEFFQQAIEELGRPGDRMVIGASQDGGYYLIGLKTPHTEPFSDIRWSTSTVAAETRERCREANLDLVELPLWYDVDDAETLGILRAELLDDLKPDFLPRRGYLAPKTRAFLLAQRDSVR